MWFARESLGGDEPALLVIVKGEFEFGFSRLIHHNQRSLVLAGRPPCFDQLTNAGHGSFLQLSKWAAAAKSPLLPVM
jgi:hypothetical protein